MADTRYLKKRRQTWYFCIKVPSNAKATIGKSDITQSLQTRDLTEAQKLRWPLVADWSARFEVASGSRSWSAAEIEQHAQREFHQTLEMMEEHSHDDDTTALFAELEGDKLANKQLPERERALTVARIQAAVGRRAALSGKSFTAPTVFGRNAIDLVTLQPVTKPKKSTGLAFSNAAERYIEETQRDTASKLTEQTRGQYEAVYRLFTQWAKDPQLADIEREQVAAFLDKVATLDPHWGRSPQTKQRDFNAIYELYGNHETGLSNRTINRYATALSLVWQWAKRRSALKGENPFDDQHRKIGEKRKTTKYPYTTEELKLLVSSPDATPSKQTTKNTLAWLCLISAYSGLRLNEMCDRKTTDLKQENGVWYFDVANAKSEAGDRRVPVHSILIKAGLLDFVNHHKDEWLFPHLKAGGPDKKRSWYITQRFTEHRRKLGVTRIDDRTGKERVDFHSFRRTAIKALERARLPQTEVAQVVGHERGGITYGTYNPDGLDIKALQEVVEAISYPELEATLQ
ncbi:site-specific integrase [Pseudochrobactrum kiredjianiae]|uniref:DUF6538 domain-containing protein n=1 Tax=Pseudochrobactrum kiredjianiae TaxID=386305 RepID=A0ABW3V704_9HYPH|nr:site-specific integrase [Pseudochrobactrum kiredjianiae]MDM7850426.1 site-specific integrase [Pseudochrobactrum kiredjianiae]